MHKILYHLIASQLWRTVSEEGSYQPQSLAVEGFIHCSFKEQVVATANRYYQGQADLLLLEIDPNLVSAPIKYENLNGRSEAFPHIYGPLAKSSVTATHLVKPLPDGSFTEVSFGGLFGA